MPHDGIENQTATTPGRYTELWLDSPYPVVKEPPVWMVREKEQIARRGLDRANSENVRRMAGGAIALTPLAMQAGQLQERLDSANGVIPLSEWDTPAGMFIARPQFRQLTELPGVTYGASVPASSDNFIGKIIGAGINWLQTLLPDITAFGQPTYPTDNVPMDRVMVGKTTDPANQGYVWRFSIPGTQLNSPHLLMTKYFGGPAGDSGGGAYALGVDGTGIAILFERINDAWVDRFSFRYAPPDRVCRSAHKILIKPYNFPGSAGGIEFICSSGDVAAPIGSAIGAYFQSSTLPNVHLYTIERTAPTVTGAYNPRIDMRRDLRPYVQTSRAKFPTTGTVIDGNFAIPFPVGTSQNLIIEWTGIVPAVCTLIGKLFRADTNVELTLVTAGDSIREYAMPANVHHYYARFEMTSDGTDTPTLWDYQVYRNGVIVTPTHAPIDATGTVTSVSISGPEADPSHETASITINDEKNAFPLLSTRGRVPAMLATRYNPANPSRRSVLFEGFLVKSPGQRKMRKTTEGGRGAGAVREYPAKLWKEYTGIGVGQWMRLNEKVAWQIFRFVKDPDVVTAPGDPDQPWKITDIVRRLLTYAGYTDEQIDVPDNPMRLWTGNGEQLSLTPMRPLGQFCVDLLKEYLGWFMVWDGNAGTRGKWRAIAPSIAPYNHLAHFYTEPVSTGRLIHSAGNYGNANAGYWSETGAVSAFIQAGSMRPFVKPPEANAVLVIGGGGPQLQNKQGNSIFAQWLVNRDGLDFFSGYTPDRNNPDWIGELVPLVYVDSGISFQVAADFFCRRLYDIATHGIKVTPFVAPLVLVTNPMDSSQTAARPLRYYDPITITDQGITSTFLVRSCNPFYSHASGGDAHQMAIYEVEAPTLEEANMEGIDAVRNAVEKAVLKGQNPQQPKKFTVQTHAADFITIIMSLPVESSTWSPLQDETTGELFFVAGASGLGSAPLGG